MNQQQEEAIQALISLGLTVAQAKVYLALSRLDYATGREIANESGVRSPDIYRVLSELIEKSLVRKIIAAPNKFQAIPLFDGIKSLFFRRQEKTNELMQKTKEIIDTFKGKSDIFTAYENKSFILIPKREPVINLATKKLTTLQKSYDFAAHNLEVLLEWTDDFYKEVMEAIGRGVKFRIIVNKSSSKTYLSGKLLSLLRQPSFEVKFIVDNFQFGFIIVDNREVIIPVGLKIPCEYDANILTCNRNIVAITQKLFDSTWETLKDEKALFLKCK
jgi:sugar-specific transcriptional regulator TrmB